MSRHVLPVALGAAFIALVACLPLAGDNYLLRLGTMGAMYCVLALSWNVIGGFAGYPSFATAAFFGLGAYTGAVLQAEGVPMFGAWIAASLMAAVFAAALGATILHLKGHYFAIASLVVAEVLLEITTSWTSLTGGGMGLNLPILRGWSPAEQARLFFWSMLVFAALALLMNYIVKNHRLGFGLECIRQNEDASRMVGIDTTLYKVVAFVLSAVLVGGVGALYASWVFYIEPPDVFDVLTAVKPVVMALLGGAGTVLGPVIGAIAFLAMEEFVWRNLLDVHRAALGILIVVLIFFLPHGILGLLRGSGPRAVKAPTFSLRRKPS